MNYAKIVSDAEARRAELYAELSSLEALISSATALASLQHSQSAPRVTVKTRKATKWAASPTRELTARMLSERGRPIKTAELLPLLRGRGVQVGGKDPVATLSARLSNAKDFKIHRGIGWWFTDKPLPNAQPELDEAEGRTSQALPSASKSSQGGSHAPALVE